MTGDNCLSCGLPLVQSPLGMWFHAEKGECKLPLPPDVIICLPPAEDEVLEGRVLAEGEPGYVPPAGMAQSADHWPAFAPVQVVFPPGLSGWHDEAARLEERGRLDRAGCECEDCLGDKYSGEDYY